MDDRGMGLLLLVVGFGMFFWTQKDYQGLVRAFGNLTRWGRVLPSTRFGLTCASLVSILLGMAVILHISKNTFLWHAILICMMALALVGFVHDFVCWVVQDSDSGDDPGETQDPNKATKTAIRLRLRNLKRKRRH